MLVLWHRTVSSACYCMNKQLLNRSLLIVIWSRIICVTSRHSPVFTQDLFSHGKGVLSLIYLTEFSQRCKEWVNTKATSETPFKDCLPQPDPEILIIFYVMAFKEVNSNASWFTRRVPLCSLDASRLSPLVWATELVLHWAFTTK